MEENHHLLALHGKLVDVDEEYLPCAAIHDVPRVELVRRVALLARDVGTLGVGIEHLVVLFVLYLLVGLLLALGVVRLALFGLDVIVLARAQWHLVFGDDVVHAHEIGLAIHCRGMDFPTDDLGGRLEDEYNFVVDLCWKKNPKSGGLRIAFLKTEL